MEKRYGFIVKSRIKEVKIRTVEVAISGVVEIKGRGEKIITVTKITRNRK